MALILDPDFVARPGLRFTRNFLANTTSIFLQNVYEGFVNGGWTLIETGTSGGFPTYKFESQQSPWWDPDNIPVDYEGKVRVFVSGISTEIRLEARSPDETFIQNTTSRSVLLVNTTTQYRMIINPFQFVCWIPGRTDTTCCVISVLHTPKSIQEFYSLKNCFITTTLWRNDIMDGPSSRSCGYLKHAGGVFTNQNGAAGGDRVRPLYFTDPSGTGVNETNMKAWIWNYADDPLMQNPSVGFPLLSPARISWPNTSGTGVGIKARGFLWDAFIFNKGKAPGTVYTFPNGNIGRSYTENSTGSNDRPPVTLFFMESGPVT